MNKKRKDYDHQARKFGTCGQCEHNKFLKYWLEKKVGHWVKICGVCYRRVCNLEKCRLCSRTRPVAYRLQTKTGQPAPICVNCYKTDVRRATCATCGEDKSIRLKIGGLAFCPNCHRQGKHLAFLSQP